MDANRNQIVNKAFDYREALLAYSFAIIKNWTLSEEVVQEVLVFVDGNWQKYRDGTNIFRWLKSIARRKCHEVLRANDKEITYRDDVLSEVIDNQVEASWSEGIAGEITEKIQVLRQCIVGLPIKAQRLLWAHYVKGHSYEHMASLRKRNIAYISNHLYLVRKRLKKCMMSKSSIAEGNFSMHAKSLEDLFSGIATETQRSAVNAFLAKEPEEAADVLREVLVERTALTIVIKQFCEAAQYVSKENEAQGDAEVFDLSKDRPASDYQIVAFETSSSLAENNNFSKFVFPFSVAACLLFGLGLWMWQSSKDEHIQVATIGNMEGEVSVFDVNGNARKARNGDEIMLRERISTGETGKLVLRFSGGKGYVELASNTDLSVANFSENLGVKVALPFGEVVAEITRQKGGLPVVFDTSYAEVVVLGTRFRLHASSTYSKLAVLDGLVRFSPKGDTEPVIVSGGQYALVDSESKLTTGSVQDSDSLANGERHSMVGKNLLKNPGFEEVDFTGWIMNYSNGRRDVSSQNAHSGNSSLEIVLGDKHKSVRSESIPTISGRTYIMSGWVRFDNTVIDSPYGVILARFLDENNKQILVGDFKAMSAYRIKVGSNVEQGSYLFFSRKITAPANTIAVQIWCNGAVGNGVIHFDDLSFSLVEN